jgi:hypothetical protein
MDNITTALRRRRNIAHRINEAFDHCPEVSSVLVFGSVASGQVDERSDVDMLIICRSSILPISTRERILSQIGSNWLFHKQYSPLFVDCDINGLVAGILVEVHYQTTSWISDVLNEVLCYGAITTEKLPFRPYTLSALLQRAWLLKDKDGTLKQWREQAQIFPKVLKLNILRHFIPILRENMAELKANAERDLGPRNFIFFLNWAVDALTSILFALNEIYDPADRRAEQTILPTLPYVPQDFIATLTEVLKGPFDKVGAFQRAQVFEGLALEVLRTAEAELES